MNKIIKKDILLVSTLLVIIVTSFYFLKNTQPALGQSTTTSSSSGSSTNSSSSGLPSSIGSTSDISSSSSSSSSSGITTILCQNNIPSCPSGQSYICPFGTNTCCIPNSQEAGCATSISCNGGVGNCQLALSSDFTGKWLGVFKSIHSGTGKKISRLVELTLCVKNGNLTGKITQLGKIIPQNVISANEVQILTQDKKQRATQLKLKLVGTRQLQVIYIDSNGAFIARKLNSSKLCAAKGFTPKN